MKLKGGTLDIESYPGTWRAFVDKMYETRVLKEVTPHMPASFSFKPYRGGPTVTRGVWEYKNTKEFLWDLWDVFNDNDFLIGHFVKNFDHRQSNTFFAQFGLPAPSKTTFYCTKEITKKHFKLPSYSLKYLLAFFGIGLKLETGGEELWFKTEAGDPKARKKMLTYNKNDTVQTEKLFLFLVDGGWTEAPGSRYYTKENGCPRCHSHDKENRGFSKDADGVRRQYLCKNCGKRPRDEELVMRWDAKPKRKAVSGTK